MFHDNPSMVLFIVVIILLSAIVVLWKNALPFPDRGSFIFTAVSAESRKTLIELMKKYGQTPAFKADDPNGMTKRAIYRSGLVLSVVERDTLTALGNAGGGFAVVTSNPLVSAHWAVNFLI